jgi:rubrerythrin
MPYKSARKRFGYSAIKKGFITEDQFVEAMRIQISIEQKDGGPPLIGEIMIQEGLMTNEEMQDIIKDTPEFERYKCPVCGMLLHECPNCAADLMNFGM